MLTHERLKQLIDYNPETGSFVWRVYRAGNAKAGQQAGTVTPNGYLQIFVDRQQFLAHRLAWFYVHGALPPEHLDHINGDKLDNRIDNLREADKVINGRNCKRRVDNKSGVTGVRWREEKRRWQARMRMVGKDYHLGYFHNKEEAIAARKAAEREHNFHPNHGRD